MRVEGIADEAGPVEAFMVREDAPADLLGWYRLRQLQLAYVAKFRIEHERSRVGREFAEAVAELSGLLGAGE